jgi:predicted RNase H-like nuclease (RuvC/YqgF family)
MATTPSSTQLELPQPVSSGLPQQNENRSSGKNGYQKRIDKITQRNHALQERIQVLEAENHALKAENESLKVENEFFLKQILQRLDDRECTAEALAVYAESLAQQSAVREING